jgi:hypothetical protein
MGLIQDTSDQAAEMLDKKRAEARAAQKAKEQMKKEEKNKDNPLL